MKVIMTMQKGPETVEITSKTLTIKQGNASATVKVDDIREYEAFRKRHNLTKEQQYNVNTKLFLSILPERIVGRALAIRFVDTIMALEEAGMDEGYPPSPFYDNYRAMRTRIYTFYGVPGYE